MDEYPEDLPGSALPVWPADWTLQERTWHRFLRGTGVPTETEALRRL